MVAAVSIRHAAEIVPGLAAGWSVLFTQLPLGILGIALVTGLAEEPGWRGYAQPTANQRFRPLVAALVVSVIWAAWHLPNALFGPNMTETLTHFLATVVNGLCPRLGLQLHPGQHPHRDAAPRSPERDEWFDHPAFRGIRRRAVQRRVLPHLGV